MAAALAAAHRAGLVKAVGVSNYSETRDARHPRRAGQARHPARHQPGRVLAAAHHARDERPAARLHASSASSCSPTRRSAQGRLTGKYSAANPPPGKRNFSDYPDGRDRAAGRRAAPHRRAHGGKTPAQVALNWVICKGAVPIPGAKNRQQAEQNAGALGWRLSPDDVAGARSRQQARPARADAPRLAARVSTPCLVIVGIAVCRVGYRRSDDTLHAIETA